MKTVNPAARDGDLTVACIEQRAQLSELVPAWDDLLARSDAASPFLTPEWQLAWLDTYGRDHRPFVLIARRGEELVGLWALATRRRGLFTILEPLGARRADWVDVLTSPTLRRAVIAAFLAYLERHRRRWDLVELRDVLADSPLAGLLTDLCPDAAMNFRSEPRTAAPYLPLSGTWEEFLTAKRGKFRSNLKYYRRLAERDGQRAAIGRVAWRDDLVDDLAAIEQRSWKARDGNLKVSTTVGKEFYRRVCGAFAQRGWLDLWRIAINDVPVAFVLNFIYRGKCYHYNTCYDEAAGYMSPGMLLHAQAIADAYERGLSEYDFLSGDEPYKERWCSERRRIDHLVLSNGRAVSLAARAALVDARWKFRRSDRLRKSRQHLLSAVRTLVRASARG